MGDVVPAVGPAGVAIAKGVLELQPCQGEVNRTALVELAFARRSVALANGWYNGLSLIHI